MPLHGHCPCGWGVEAARHFCLRTYLRHLWLSLLHSGYKNAFVKNNLNLTFDNLLRNFDFFQKSRGEENAWCVSPDSTHVSIPIFYGPFQYYPPTVFNYQLISCKIRGGWSDTGAHPSLSCFCFPLLVYCSIPISHCSLRCGDIPDQAAQYHNLSCGLHLWPGTWLVTKWGNKFQFVYIRSHSKLLPNIYRNALVWQTEVKVSSDKLHIQHRL
jgi:hypothetical protein